MHAFNLIMTEIFLARDPKIDIKFRLVIGGLMSYYSKLKSTWKKLGIKGQVKNYSSIKLWVLENDSKGYPIARILEPGFKTPNNIDIDAFKRIDNKAIKGHKNWWKFYDFSIVDISENSSGLKISVVSMTPVKEKHFNKVTYIHKS